MLSLDVQLRLGIGLGSGLRALALGFRCGSFAIPPIQYRRHIVMFLMLRKFRNS